MEWAEGGRKIPVLISISWLYFMMSVLFVSLAPFAWLGRVRWWVGRIVLEIDLAYSEYVLSICSIVWVY